MTTNSNSKIASNIALQLEQKVLDGTFIPEQKLPSERKLAQQFGVSRSIVREAINQLQGKGVVRTIQGSGSFVSEIIEQPEENSALLQLFFGHSRTLYDLYEVREQLEGQAAFLAAQRATKRDEYRISQAFEALMSGNSKPEAELDHEFHKTIAEASHNPVLIHILNSLKDLILHSVQASVCNLRHREKFRAHLDRHHRQIYNAVMAKQAKKAENAARAHVKYVSSSLNLIEEQEKTIIRGG